MTYKTHGSITFGLREDETGQVQSLEDVLNSLVTDELAKPAGGAAVGGASYAKTGATTSRSQADQGADTLSVLDYGAVGDGSTDDGPAFNAAITALISSTTASRRLIGPPRTYAIDTWIDLRGVSDLVIDMPGATLLGTKSTMSPIGTHQPGIITTLPQDVAAAALTGIIRIGSRSCTLADADDPLKPTAGDFVFIMCGLIATNVPFCELNKVISVDGTAITLAWPTGYDYRDMGDGQPYAIGVVTDQVASNVTLRGLTISHPTIRGIYELLAYRLRIENCHFTGHGAASFRGRTLDLDYTFDLAPNWGGTYNPYCLALDAGAMDIRARISGRSRGSAPIHLHECVKCCDLDAVVEQGNEDVGTVSTPWPSLSIRSISLGVHVRRLYVINNFHAGATNTGVIDSTSSSTAGQGYDTYGNKGLVIDDLQVFGVITNPTATARVISHTSGQDHVVIRNVDASQAIVDNVETYGSGEIWTAAITIPIPKATANSGLGAEGTNAKMVAGGGSNGTTQIAPTSATKDGEVVFVMNKAATPVLQVGAQIEMDVPKGGWTRAIGIFEVENNNDATSGHAAFFRQYAKGNTAATAVDFTSGTTTATVAQKFDGSGSPRYIRQSFDIGANGRVGFRLRWDPTNESDTMATGTDVLIRRASIAFCK